MCKNDSAYRLFFFFQAVKNSYDRFGRFDTIADRGNRRDKQIDSVVFLHVHSLVKTSKHRRSAQVSPLKQSLQSFNYK